MANRYHRPWLAAVPTLLLLIAISQTFVLGHAELATASPADGTTMTEPPTEIVLTFSEALDPKKSSIVVAEVGNPPIASGGVVSTTNPKEMTLRLPDIGNGAYEVRWTSASALDGDLARGTTHFTVSGPTASPTDDNSVPPPTPNASSLVSSAAAPSAAPSQTSTSTSDALIPVIAAVLILAGLGLWLLRNRSRGAA